MKFAVVVFPGSNCDHDAYYAAEARARQDAEFVWHKDTSLKGADAVILPGGFAHGDYLRTGAIARFSPIMQEVQAFAAAGGPVLGICNGFQVLLEAGLLPGAMLRNRSLQFRCEHVHVKVEQTDTPFTAACGAGPGAAHSHRARRRQLLRRAGRHRAARDEIARSSSATSTASGDATDAANPNGSVHNIAGHLQRGAQRRRPDAASRARVRAGRRQRRRSGAVRVRAVKAVSCRAAVSAAVGVLEK